MTCPPVGKKEIFYILTSGQVRSGQVTASSCSAHLSRAGVLAFVSSSVRDRKTKRGGNKGGGTCTGEYKGVQAVRPESVAGGGWFEVL